MHINETMDHCVSADLCKKTVKRISSSSSGSSSTENALSISKLDTGPCTSDGTCKQTIKGIATSSSSCSSCEDPVHVVKLDVNPCVSADSCKQTIKGIATSSSSCSSCADAVHLVKVDRNPCVSADSCKQTIKGISTSSSSSSSPEDVSNKVKLDIVRCKHTLRGTVSTSSSSTTSTEEALKLNILPCKRIGPCKQRRIQISSTSSSTSTASFNDALGPTIFDIDLTNKGFQIYKTRKKRKLFKILTDRLEQCVYAQKNLLKSPASTTIERRRLWISIQSGLYSTNILKILLEKGMSVHAIIKAMKLGLINLTYGELVHFKHFKVEPYILEEKIMWPKMLSYELISNLKTTGLTDSECWDIIVCGLRFQCSRILYHLMLSGIDVPGVLSWQSPINTASPKIIRFLKGIGIYKDLLELVEEYGIDDETIQMLIDLGFHESKDKWFLEDIICDCSLTTLESQKISLDTKSISGISRSRSSSTPTPTSDYFHPCICQCHLGAEKNTTVDFTAQRNDYLRQNIMVPLSWAMSRTAKLRPTDALHYIMYELLNWKHNVPETKKDDIHEFVALATIELDRKLVAKKLLDEEDLIRIQNEKAMENIPCSLCIDRQQMRRIKKKCAKCIKRPFKEFQICKFPEVCSSCKINLPVQSFSTEMSITGLK